MAMLKLMSFLRKRLSVLNAVFKVPYLDVIYGAAEEVLHVSLPWSDGMVAHIVLEHIDMRSASSLIFIEAQGLQLVATTQNRDCIYASQDGGRTWRWTYKRAIIAGSIRCAFTLASGERIVRTDAGEMHHFDPGGKLLAIHATGRWPWHGSQGIGQSASGAVLYAEYAPVREKNDVQMLHVWRYHPYEGAWSVVFSIEAGVRPNGQIRHFHVCRPNPANPRQWLLSSGDAPNQCRLWTSEDDGDSWVEIDATSVAIPEIPAKSRQRIFRFTQFSTLLSGDVIWATDDLLGSGRAALIKMSYASSEPSFHFLGWLGDNCVRNIIACGDDRFFLISESKNQAMFVDMFLYDHQTGGISRVTLPNLRRQRCPVTASLGSSQVVDGYAFVPSLGNVFTCKRRGLLRIRIDGPYVIE